MSVEFRDPPPAKPGAFPVLHAGVAAELRANPGRWGVIGTYCSSKSAQGTAYVIRTGRRRVWEPAGDFDACSRTEDGKYLVYARYIGGSEDE